MTTQARRAHLIVFGLLLMPVVTLAQSNVPESDRFAYIFDCAGQYVRIDLGAGTQSEPARVPGVAAGFGGSDVCLIEAVAADLPRSTVYAAMPTQRRLNSLGRGLDKVVALQLPSLTLLSAIGMPFPGDRIPALRLDPGAAELSVRYRTPHPDSVAFGDGVEFAVSTEHPEALAFRTRPDGTAAPQVISEPILSGAAHVEKSGRFVDGDRVGQVYGFAKTVDGSSLLTDSIRQKFQSLHRIGAAGNKYLEVLFAGSASGRMLFLAPWDRNGSLSPAGGGLLVYDAINEKVLSAILTPYRMATNELIPGTPTVHLNADGRIAVVEEYRWITSDAGGGQSIQERFKTGKIALYDAASGTPLRTVELNPPPGLSGRVAGFSPDGALMYYASAQDLYVVDLLHGQSQAIKLPPGFSPEHVITADR